MANKLYEENSIRAIADRLRRFAPYSTYTVSQMADGVEGACQAQYESGRDAGFAEGELSGVNKVKTEEARTGADVVTIVEVPNRNVEVSVTGGYYANETVVNVDVQPVYYAGYNLGYDDGHSDGYDDGFAAGVESGGGGGTDPLLEEMLIATDVNYDDEGNQFYSVYKWIGAYHTNFSSVPFTLNVMNNHPTLYMHVYITVYGAFYSEDEGAYNDERFGNYTLTIGPDQEENSIEVDAFVYDYYIEGVRWSEDGV